MDWAVIGKIILTFAAISFIWGGIVPAIRSITTPVPGRGAGAAFMLLIMNLLIFAIPVSFIIWLWFM